MSGLVVKDLIERLSTSSNSEVGKFLFEQAKAASVPLATERSYIKYCENLKKTYISLRKSINRTDGQSKCNKFLNENVVFPQPASKAYVKGRILKILFY